jgi:gluconokinase
MTYYLGVDIGTTATKAVAFSERGEVVAMHAEFYAMHHPREGWSEQDPDELFAAVTNTIHSVVAQLHPSLPLFVSFSAAMHSLVAVDAKGQPLTPCIIWADNRAAEIAARLRSTDKGEAFYKATGVPIHPMSLLCKLLWLKELEPSLFQKAARFISIKEYVWWRLFGEYVVDTSIASTTGLLDIDTLNWHPGILEFAGITPDRLSRLVPPTYILKAKEPLSACNLPPGIPFVVGASDGALANLGAGAMEPHTLAISIGTSSAIRTVVHQPLIDKAMRTFCYHLEGSNYIVGGASNNGAVVLQWLKEKVLQTDETYDELLAQAETVAPGSEGLVFAPYLLGERAPLWDPQARGVFIGFGMQHTRAHLIRATIEGIVYCLYSMGQPLLKGGGITGLRVSGGFARSALPLQVLADVFNTPVTVSASVESSARGAVLLGAQAMGITIDWEEEAAAVYTPRTDAYEVYQQRIRVFEQVPAFLKTIV